MDCVSIIHCVSLRFIISFAVWVGHALDIADDLDDAVILVNCVVVVYFVSYTILYWACHLHSLDNYVTVSVGHRLRDRDKLLHCITLWNVDSDAVQVGDALSVTNNLVDAVELVFVVGDGLEQLVRQRVWLNDAVVIGVCELVWDHVSVLQRIIVQHALLVTIRIGNPIINGNDFVHCVRFEYCFAMQYALRIKVWIGHALDITDNLINAVELIYVVRNELEQLVRQRVWLSDVVAIGVCELVWDCVSVLQCINMRYAFSVSIGVGHFVHVVDDLTDIVIIADCVIIV